jgi:DNA-directed RNA polymerase specialized sigma24 family protein
MRRILIESARHKNRVRHGGDSHRHELTDALLASVGSGNGNSTIDPITLDEALSKLEKEDAPKAQLVKLRFFAGLSVEQAAAILQISRATADRWWAYARAFLYCELQAP